jgi:hypothetical protein
VSDFPFAGMIVRRPGGNPTTRSCNATSRLVRFENKIVSSTLRNALDYYSAGVTHSFKFESSRFGSWRFISIVESVYGKAMSGRILFLVQFCCPH